MAANFASTGDLADKKITFAEIGRALYAFTAEGDPNSGVIVGDDGVMVIDAQATPTMAGLVIERVRQVTDKPIKYVVLSHYHAVRVPTVTFKDHITLYLGKRRVDLLHIGRAHTAGDIIAHVPDANVVFSGDIVEYKSACYCGDAHFTDWPATLDRLGAFKAEALVPGRGDALVGTDTVAEGIALTRDFLRDTYEPVRRAVAHGGTLKACFDAATAAMRPKYGSWPIFDHCQPFNIARAYDEAQGIDTPRVWTAERDRAMWAALQG